MNRLRLLRNEREESLEQIAKYLNVTVQTISNYETEKRDMTPNTIIKLATYFDVSTDYLLGKSDIRNPERISYTTPSEIQSYYNELNETGKQKAIENVKDLTKIDEYTDKKDEKKDESQNA